MGFLDFLFKKPFGDINPSDPSSYKQAYAEYTQAQMQEDSESALGAFYKKWNIKGEDHWSEIETQMMANGQHMAAVQAAMQGQVSQAYQAAGMGGAMGQDVEGIGVEVYAQLCAQLERATDPQRRAQVLQAFGCDEARFGRVQAGFNQMMSTPQGATLAGQFHQQLALARQGG